jgi:hypothetical protein
MRDELKTLVASVEKARSAVLNAAASLTDEQGAFKPRDAWSIAEIIEHLYLAELSGVTKIWAAADGLRAGNSWTGELPNRGKGIEQIVAETWKSKEVAPPIATPHLGGPLRFWLSALPSLRPVLADLASALQGHSLDDVVFPHYLSGPLDARQRLEFLRCHMERHLEQIGRTREDPAFLR